jgi:hypothetical protein
MCWPTSTTWAPGRASEGSPYGPIQPGFPGLSAGGFEFEMLLGLCCLAFLFGGGGRYSVDHAIGKEF